MATPSNSGIGSLRRKVLTPFFAILLCVGTAATIGSLYAINNSLIKTSDERLSAFQQQIYREIRNLESDLSHKAKLLDSPIASIIRSPFPKLKQTLLNS